MKKLLTILIVLAVLVAGGLAALGFGLRSVIQEQTLNALGNMTMSPQGKAYTATAEQVNFSPLSREMSIRGLSLQGERPQGPETWQVAEISFRLPVRMLLVFTPLRNMVLDGKDMVDVAENVVLRNLAMTAPDNRVAVQREEIDVIRAMPFLVRQTLERHEPVDMVAATYSMGADNTHAHFITVDIPGPSGSTRLSLKETSMRGWQGRTIDSIALNGLEVRVDGTPGISIGHIRQEGLTLPDEDLLRRIVDASGQADPDEALNQLMPLMETVLGAEPPLLRKAYAADMTFAVETSSVQVKEAVFEWLSNAPVHTRSSVKGLTAPSSLLRALLDLTLPPLNMDMAFESRSSGAASHKTALVSAAGLGVLDCEVKLNEKPGTNALEDLLTQSFSDFSLKYKDEGLTAWLGLNISTNVPQAVGALEALAALPGVRAGQQNDVIRRSLQTFAARPGSLEIQTTPGRTALVLDLIALLDNPGMLLTVTAKPGEHALREQMEALRLTFEAIQAVSSGQ